MSNKPEGTKLKIEIDGKAAYLSAPSFDILNSALGYILNAMSEPDYITAGEILLKACWLDGDQEMKDANGPFFIPACVQVAMACLDFMESSITPVKDLLKGEEIPGEALYLLKVGDKSCYLSDVSRETYSKVLGKTISIMGNPDYLGAGELALREAFITGDEEIINFDSEYYMTACFKMAVKYMEFKQAKLEKF